jgi:hypothetical protein
MAWGVLYLLLTIWWWPAALVALAIVTTAQVKARETTGVLADLLEGSHHPDAQVPLGPGLTCCRLTPARRERDQSAGVARCAWASASITSSSQRRLRR